MYYIYIYGISVPSLRIESTNSMISGLVIEESSFQGLLKYGGCVLPLQQMM